MKKTHDQGGWGKLVQENAVDEADTKTLLAPNPGQSFYVSGPAGACGRYTANEKRIIANVAQIHLPGLQAAGCKVIS